MFHLILRIIDKFCLLLTSDNTVSHVKYPLLLSSSSNRLLIMFPGKGIFPPRTEQELDVRDYMQAALSCSFMVQIYPHISGKICVFWTLSLLSRALFMEPENLTLNQNVDVNQKRLWI